MPQLLTTKSARALLDNYRAPTPVVNEAGEVVAMIPGGTTVIQGRDCVSAALSLWNSAPVDSRPEYAPGSLRGRQLLEYRRDRDKHFMREAERAQQARRRDREARYMSGVASACSVLALVVGGPFWFLAPMSIAAAVALDRIHA